MGIRTKRGKLEYRFQIHGRSVQQLTDLADTPANRKKAAAIEAAHRDRLRLEIFSGQRQAARLAFNEAVTMFTSHNDRHYTKGATARRIAVSMTSASLFFGRSIVAEIQAGHVEQYAHWRATEHEVRPITIRHDLHALSLFWQWAERHGYATHNPVDEVPIPSDQDAIRQHILTAEEESRYFDGYTNPDDGKRYRAAGTLRDVARLILLQGMRPAEVLNLRKENIDLAAGTLRITDSKTRAGRRTLYLCEEARAILRRRMPGQSPYVFPSPDDAAKPIQKVNGAHDRLAAAIGATWVLYDLRHTFATRLKALGVDDFALAAILGHASTRTLPRYVHPTQQHQDDAMKRYQDFLANQQPQQPPIQENPCQTITSSPPGKGGRTSR